MIEIIPFPIHALILFGLWIFAARRGGPFPFRLVSLYAAFFILSSVSNYLVTIGKITYTAHIIFSSLFICALYDDAKEGRSIKSVNKFCCAMFAYMAMTAYALLVKINTPQMSYELQSILINIHNLISVILSLYVIYILIEVIDGRRGDPIYKRAIDVVFYCLSVFTPHREVFHYQEEIEGFHR